MATTAEPGVTRSRVLHPLLALLLVASLSACGLTAPRSSDGFADFDSLGIVDTDLVMSLSIGPALLHFAARHVDDDPETEALLRSLDGVRVRVYEIEGEPLRVAERMSHMSDRLQRDGWERVMTVRDGGDRADVLLRTDGQHIHGMTVLVSDGESEAVLVNLMGDIRPEQFSHVMAAIDVDAGSANGLELPAQTGG
jgi:hypothetical protein